MVSELTKIEGRFALFWCSSYRFTWLRNFHFYMLKLNVQSGTMADQEQGHF